MWKQQAVARLPSHWPRWSLAGSWDFLATTSGHWLSVRLAVTQHGHAPAEHGALCCLLPAAAAMQAVARVRRGGERGAVRWLQGAYGGVRRGQVGGAGGGGSVLYAPFAGVGARCTRCPGSSTLSGAEAQHACCTALDESVAPAVQRMPISHCSIHMASTAPHTAIFTWKSSIHSSR